MIRGVQKSERGCSLAEVLTAMSVLTTIMMGSLALLMHTQKSLASGGQGLQVTGLAETRIEAFRTLPYATLLTPDFDGDGVADLVLIDHGNGEFTGQQTVHDIKLLCTVIPDGPDPSGSPATTVRVKADWFDRQGQPKTLTYAFRRANPVYSGVSL
jgi:hypothetical protein